MAEKKKKLDREELAKIAKKRVVKAFTSYQNRSTMEDKWRGWDANYNLMDYDYAGDGGSDRYSGPSNLHPPATRKAVQTNADYFVDVLFPVNSEWNRIKPVNGDDADYKRADIYKKLSDVQNEKNSLRDKVGRASYLLERYGFVLVKFPYELKEKYIVTDKGSRDKYKSDLRDFLDGSVEKW